LKSILTAISFFLFLSAEVQVAQITKLGRSVDHISRYIASVEFQALQKENNQLALLDSIYLFALDYEENDISDALFDLTFSVIPYNHIPLASPNIGLRINIPLPHSADSIYTLKNRNLPKNLFYDSPNNELGDKDKLAHFFGSAYLSYSSSWFDITEIIGIFVEDFEEKFYVQSKVDLRDIRADNLGNIFGKALKENINVLPSQVFSLYHLTLFRYGL
jgi:hypothetical protein